MEIAVKPLHMRRPDVAEEYEVLLANYPNLAIAALDRPTVRRAAELRAEYRLRPADALQVAACLEQGATVFLSNDRELRRNTDSTIFPLDGVWTRFRIMQELPGYQNHFCQGSSTALPRSTLLVWKT